MLMISMIDLPKSEQHAHAHRMLGECLKQYKIEYSPDTPIIKGEQGKPSLAERPDIRFNLSHADGIAACIVNERECGIDCERVRPYRPNVLRRAFSASEKALIEAAPESERDLLFFRLWTLKEAYVKALGIGVSYPLSTAAFSFEGYEIVTAIEDYDFRQYIIKDEFVVSTAVSRL